MTSDHRRPTTDAEGSGGPPSVVGGRPEVSHLVVARVLAPHGVRGELKCRLVTDFPERFRRGSRVYVGDPPVGYTVQGVRHAPGLVYLRLQGLSEREAAERLRGAEVQVRVEEAVELAPNQFYWHQVIGLRVEDMEGRDLGTVADIIETGANDVYVARGPAGEMLIPAIKDVVKSIEPERGRIVIDPLPGMLPEPARRPRGPRRFSRRSANPPPHSA